MNAFWHQWKWDLRHIRTLWIVWVLLLVTVGLAPALAPFMEGAPPDLAPLLWLVQLITMFLFGVLLVGRLMYATPFAGSRAFWKTRPLARKSLFMTKSAMIVLLIWLPVVVVQLTGWAMEGATLRYFIWGGLQFGGLVLAMVLLAAVWAAVCERFGAFLLCFVGTWAWAAVVAIIARKLADGVAALPVFTESARAAGYHPAVNASTMIVSMVIMALGAAVAWILAGTGRGRKATVAAVAVVVAVVAVANTASNLWRVGFLAKEPARPEVAVPVTVLHRADEPKAGQQVLWSELAIDVAAGQFAWVTDASVVFRHSKGVTSFSADQQSAVSVRDRADALAGNYPETTEMLVTENRTRATLFNQDIKEHGIVEGELVMRLMEWRKVATLPAVPGARARRSDGGMVTITGVSGVPGEARLDLAMVQPPRGFRLPNPMQYHHRNGLGTAFVLHQPGKSRAIFGERGHDWSTRGMPFAMESHRERVVFAGTTELAGEISEEAVLDLYEAVPVATATERFREESWRPYGYRRFKTRAPNEKPAIPVVPKLAANPGAEQVEAFLDGILFNLSDGLSGGEWQKTRERLKRIGPEHLERLVARLPVGDYADDLVHAVINDLATDEHRDVLVGALERDERLAGLFLQRNWDAAAAPVLKKRLQRRVPLIYNAMWPTVAIVARQNDPATYDDLYWHFVQARSIHRRITGELAACPGFPLDEAIAEAWAMARFEEGGRREQLAVLAARTGDKEALRAAFVSYMDQRVEDDLRWLAKVVKHPGGDLLPGWIHENFEALEFDPQERKWGMP